MLESLILVRIGYINLYGSLHTLTWYFCWLQNPGEGVLFWSWLPTWAGAVVKGCSFGSVNQVLDGAVFKWWQHWTVSLQDVWADRGCPVPEKFCLPFCGVGWVTGRKQLNLVLLVAEHFSSLPASEQDQELKKLSCSEPGAGIWEGKIGMDNIWAYIVWLVTSLIFQLRRFK